MFTSSITACPVNQRQSSNVNTAVVLPGTGFIADPVLVVGDYHVSPHDDTVDQKYIFYVKVTADGLQSSFFGPYTLIVGCTSDMTANINSGSYVLITSLFVSNSALGVFTIPAATVTPSYCTLQSTSITNLQRNGVSSSGDIIASASCGGSQPCLSLDLASTMTEYQLTFNIAVNIEGGFTQ